MVINFLNPSAFWGLLAFIVPTIILFLSKQKQQVVEFGTLEFLEASESKTARKIFPTEWLLYFLRMAIITLIVLILAEPVWQSENSQKKTFIESEVAEDPLFQQVMETIGEDNEIIDIESLSLLINKLNKEADSVVVYTRSYAKDYKGSIPKLGPHIEWHVVPNESDYLQKDTFRINDQIQELSISSGEDGLKWKSGEVESEIETQENDLAIQLIASPNRSGEKQSLMSLLKAYENVLPLHFKFDTPEPTWTFILDTTDVSISEKRIRWNDFEGEMELSTLHSDLHEIRGALTQNNLRASDFPLTLAHILLADQFKMEEIDRRVLVPTVDSNSTPILKGSTKFEPVQYGWILILLLITVERWLNRKSVQV